MSIVGTLPISMGVCLQRRSFVAGQERGRMDKTERKADGKYVDKDAVPKKGTKLTTERIARHYRSLNPQKRD